MKHQSTITTIILAACLVAFTVGCSKDPDPDPFAGLFPEEQIPDAYWVSMLVKSTDILKYRDVFTGRVYRYTAAFHVQHPTRNEELDVFLTDLSHDEAIGLTSVVDGNKSRGKATLLNLQYRTYTTGPMDHGSSGIQVHGRSTLDYKSFRFHFRNGRRVIEVVNHNAISFVETDRKKTDDKDGVIVGVDGGDPITVGDVYSGTPAQGGGGQQPPPAPSQPEPDEGGPGVLWWLFIILGVTVAIMIACVGLWLGYAWYRRNRAGAAGGAGAGGVPWRDDDEPSS